MVWGPPQCNREFDTSFTHTHPPVSRSVIALTHSPPAPHDLRKHGPILNTQLYGDPTLARVS